MLWIAKSNDVIISDGSGKTTPVLGVEVHGTTTGIAGTPYYMGIY